MFHHLIFDVKKRESIGTAQKGQVSKTYGHPSRHGWSLGLAKPHTKHKKRGVGWVLK